MMGVLTIRLHMGGWILNNIQEQVLKAAAQVAWRGLVGVPDGLQLLYGHQLICLRWQACTAAYAVTWIQTHAAATWLHLRTVVGLYNAGAFMKSTCMPIGWEFVCLPSASAQSRETT